ncbi:MAG: formylglycine-generating enzyme family protein, partial [Myxococcota bacterium]|nr:formylglycine-generating enzyme family protein [Myxococcota bacterium]
TAAHCRASQEACKENGLCAFTRQGGGACVLSCRDSAQCKDEGLCAFHDGACVLDAAGCRTLEPCKDEGVCGFEDGECVPNAAGCRASKLCKEEGTCGFEDGDCAPNAAGCRASKACKQRGLCSDGKEAEKCVAESDADCRLSMTCREDGNCAARGGACKEPCQNTEGCRSGGLCDSGPRGCIASTPSSCAEARSCKTNGKCTPDGGRCIARGEDCKAAVACKETGRCQAHDGECVQDVAAAKRAFEARFQRLAPGTFMMGSPESEEGRYDREGPAHQVSITRAFSLHKTPVTQRQWRKLMGESPAELSFCADCPVARVSWWDAAAYANALSKREGLPACYELSGCSGRPGDGSYTCSGVKVTARGGNPTKCKGYRLPTEAEWEYAARAGTTGPRYGELDRIAWNEGNSGKTTHPVGKKQANA